MKQLDTQQRRPDYLSNTLATGDAPFQFPEGTCLRLFWTTISTAVHCLAHLRMFYGMCAVHEHKHTHTHTHRHIHTVKTVATMAERSLVTPGKKKKTGFLDGSMPFYVVSSSAKPFFFSDHECSMISGKKKKNPRKYRKIQRWKQKIPGFQS